MRICVTGATGFIGRALVPALQRDGHTVVVWARSPERARARLGAEVEVVRADGGVRALSSVLARCDGVVNLAGEPIVGRRWSVSRKKALEASRVATTMELVEALGAAATKPPVLVSASAVGFYGDRGTETLDEDAAPGDGYLARLCLDWESAALRAEGHGTRVVMLRTGMVLGRDGGAFAQMVPAFRIGFGGPLGSGRQFMPWIHLHDLVRLVITALTDSRCRGAINGVAPGEATGRTVAAVLGRVLGRPAVLPVPAAMLRLALGEASCVLLSSQRVHPAVAMRLGFRFSFPSLESALADIVSGAAVTVAPLTTPPAAGADETSRRYLSSRRPTFELRTTTVVPAPLSETFAFFAKAENLGMITPASMRFSICGAAPAIGDGAAIDYRVRIGLTTLRWRSRIASWQPGHRFVDLQERGPYRAWWHEHSFREEGGRTVMEDRVCYAPPLGLLGRLVNRIFIAPALRRIFQYRGDVIRLRFGSC